MVKKKLNVRSQKKPYVDIPTPYWETIFRPTQLGNHISSHPNHISHPTRKAYFIPPYWEDIFLFLNCNLAVSFLREAKN